MESASTESLSLVTQTDPASQSESDSDCSFSPDMSMDSLLNDLVDVTIGFATRMGIVPQFETEGEADKLRDTIMSVAPGLAERVVQSSPEILKTVFQEPHHTAPSCIIEAIEDDDVSDPN
jgi:hypothetical protein